MMVPRSIIARTPRNDLTATVSPLHEWTKIIWLFSDQTNEDIILTEISPSISSCRKFFGVVCASEIPVYTKEYQIWPKEIPWENGKSSLAGILIKIRGLQKLSSIKQGEE